METLLPKCVYYSDADFKFEIQQIGNEIALHCEVYNWKPSILRRGYSVLNTLIKESTEKDISKLFTITPNPKFAKLLGGKSIAELHHNGKEYKVVIWDLKSQQ